jgi:hypothetical protein
MSEGDVAEDVAADNGECLHCNDPIRLDNRGIWRHKKQPGQNSPGNIMCVQTKAEPR